MKAKYPVPITDINEGKDRVIKITCGANFSLCYTEFGILYYWGMLIPDDVDSIEWFPNFMPISFPKDLNYQESSFEFSDIKASFR